MVCIYCGGITSVTNSRKTVRKHTTWRRRRCRACTAVFTSFETVDLQQSLMIRKNNGMLEYFNPDKLFISIYESCKHRPEALTDARELTRTIQAHILQQLPKHTQPGLIEHRVITGTALATLTRFDAAAAMHYDVYFIRKA